MQWIDRRVGAPCCFALTLLRRLAGGMSRRGPDGAWRSVLFVKLAEQGSTVLAHEAIRRAVERVGRDNVYFLVFDDNRFILDALGLIPECNVFAVRTRSAWTMAWSGLRRIREIRRHRIDACVDMEFFARFSAIAAFLSGARRRVGFHAYFGEGPYRGDLFTHRLLYNAHLHTSRVFAALVRALDSDPAGLPTLAFAPADPAPLPLFRPLASERDDVRRILEAAGVASGARLILLNPNASDLLPLRKWDGKNYVELARRLIAEFPRLAVVFTGSPEEAGPVADLARAAESSRCVCVAGATTLRQLMALYGISEVLVTNDSGPAHFAALTEIDVIALFGPETPLLFGAPGPRSHTLWAGIACSPCVNAFNNRQTTCRNNLCMQAITVDQVFGEACRIYRRKTEG